MNAPKTQSTDGERLLIEQFRAYLDEIFQHDDVKSDATLMEKMTRLSFDLVDAAGSLAGTDLNGELAGYLCRRACDWRHLAIEITSFLEAETAEERSELHTVQSMQCQKELQEKYGSPQRQESSEVAP